MSNLNKAILKVAQSNPEFREALKAELSKEAVSSGPVGDWIRHHERLNLQKSKKIGAMLWNQYKWGLSEGPDIPDFDWLSPELNQAEEKSIRFYNKRTAAWKEVQSAINKLTHFNGNERLANDLIYALLNYYLYQGVDQALE
jgi:hypothetical protein